MLTTENLARAKLMAISALALMPLGIGLSGVLYEVGADWFQNAWCAVYCIAWWWTYIQLRKGKEAVHGRFD